jgi:hypothetical protein
VREHPVFFDLGRKVALTYDNTSLTDGSGAQLQRIYGIYSVARLVGASYVHTGLGRVDYQGMTAFEKNRGDPDFAAGLNDLFVIPSDDVAYVDTVTVRDLTVPALRDLERRFDDNETAGAPILVRTLMPYPIADAFPRCYQVCQDLSPFRVPARDGRVLRVVLHVRRGDLLVWSPDQMLTSDRMLPNAYYINVAQGILNVLSSVGLECQVELWTEAPTMDFVVDNDHHGIQRYVSKPVLLTPEMCRLEDFDAIPSLVRHVNDATIDCLRGFATADVLVMSRSSFSYVGAILNTAGIVIYHPFWHTGLPSWIPANSDGRFDYAAFRRALDDSHAG